MYFEITRSLNLFFSDTIKSSSSPFFSPGEIKSSCLVFSFYILHDVGNTEKKAHNHPSTIFNSCWFVEFWESPFLVINLGSQCCILCQHLFERVTNGFICKQSLFGVLKLPLSPSYLLLKMISIIGDNKTSYITHYVEDNEEKMLYHNSITKGLSQIFKVINTHFYFKIPVKKVLILRFLVDLSPIYHLIEP